MSVIGSLVRWAGWLEGCRCILTQLKKKKDWRVFIWSYFYFIFQKSLLNQRISMTSSLIWNQNRTDGAELVSFQYRLMYLAPIQNLLNKCVQNTCVSSCAISSPRPLVSNKFHCSTWREIFQWRSTLVRDFVLVLNLAHYVFEFDTPARSKMWQQQQKRAVIHLKPSGFFWYFPTPKQGTMMWHIYAHANRNTTTESFSSLVTWYHSSMEGIWIPHRTQTDTVFCFFFSLSLDRRGNNASEASHVPSLARWTNPAIS